MADQDISREDLRRQKNRERAKRAYAADPEKIRERSKMWRINNPEKAKEADRRHYYDNVERSRARSKRWVKENPERAKETHRKYKTNPENRKKINLVAKEWRGKNKDKVSEYNRKSRIKRLGVESFDFDGMLATQGGACAICRNPEKPKLKGWHVDHCHSTGKIRGILCQHCNIGLGQFRDNVETLNAAIAYLTSARP